MFIAGPKNQFLERCWIASAVIRAFGLRRDPHGSLKQIHDEELEDSDKERPSAFAKIMLKQTDSGIQQLHGAGERTQEHQRRRRLLEDCPQCEQSQRNCACRRVHRQYQRRPRWNGFGRDQVLRTDNPHDGKPLATRTSIAVTTEASRIALIVVIDSSRTLACKQAQPVPLRATRFELSRDTQAQKHPAQIVQTK